MKIPALESVFDKIAGLKAWRAAYFSLCKNKSLLDQV